MGLFGDGGAKKAAEAARRAEEERQQNIKNALGAIDTAFAGFNDGFYDSRAQAYQNFALPELGVQTQDANRNLVYKLANQRLLGSSAARFTKNKLDDDVLRQKQGIVDSSMQQANQLKQQVAQEKGTLYSQALMSADPAAARSSAITSAASLQLPSTFAPVSNFLQGWANTYLSDKVAQTYNTPNGSNTNSSFGFASNPVTQRYGN